LAINNIFKSDDKQGLGVWLSYHGVKLVNSDRDVLMIEIPNKCKFLQALPDGTYLCLNYEQRPPICKNHWCEKAKG
jgi:hypothetical protein